MRKLISGIVGIIFGLFILVAGSATPSRGGAFGAGQAMGLACGGIFFLAGIPYLILGIMEMMNNSKERRPRGNRKRKRPKDRTSIPAASKDDTASKAAATKALLARLGEDDEWFDPKRLKDIVEKLFVMFQDAWAHGDFGALGKYVVHDCLDKYLDRYQNDVKRLKMAKLDDLELKRVQFVYVSAVGDAENHSFTAYLVATGPESFKEYWTFSRTAKRWKLDKIQGANVSEAVAKLNDVPPGLIAELEADDEGEEILKYVSRG